MGVDVSEEGTPCDYCGTPLFFGDDDWTVCPVCEEEFLNMDYYDELSTEDPRFPEDVSFPEDAPPVEGIR